MTPQEIGDVVYGLAVYIIILTFVLAILLSSYSFLLGENLIHIYVTSAPTLHKDPSS